MEKFFSETRHLKEKHPRVHLLIVVLVICFSVSIGMLIRDVPHTSFGHSLSVFRDILAINLATAGLFISVLSYSAYRILSIRLEQKTADFFRNKEDFLFARLFSSISFTHYIEYELSKNFDYLEVAILQAKKAHSFSRHLDSHDLDNLELQIDVLNNLCYYLASRGKKEDRDTALEYANVINKNIPLFPEKEDVLWLDTVTFARKVYSKETQKTLFTDQE